MNKRKLILMTALLMSIMSLTQVNAQSPGNVGTINLTAWFNPDNLISGVPVTSWQSTYPNGASVLTLNDATAPYPTATSTPPKGTSNYNNTISFLGNTVSSPMSLELPGAINFLNNALSTSQGTLFAVYFMDTFITAQHVVDYRESTGDAIQLRRLSATTSRLAIGTSNSLNATRDYSGDNKPMILSYSGNKATSTGLKCRVKSLEWNNNPTSSSAGTAAQLGLTIGARRNTGGAYLGVNTSYISEIIFFNTNLSLTENIKVESYLGIKYGITLDPTGLSLGNYMASNSSTIWNASSVLNYHNDVIGIGRDDNTLLNQKQSHALDDSYRMYVGLLSADNASNFTSFSSDISYVMAGHDLGLSEESALASMEIPIGQNLVGRVEREWRVTNTNMSDSYNMDFILNSLTNFTSNPSELCLLVDDDGDFSNATVYQSGLSFSVTGNTITVSGISTSEIPLNSTKYITLGYINNAVVAPVLNTTFYIQGFYSGSNNMQSVLLNQGTSGAIATEVDDVTIDLMDATSPYAMAYTFTGKLLTNGTIACTYPVAALGNNYYIRITHRNSIETWSANPVTISSSTSYDFSTSASQAYGGNQIDYLMDGVYSIYNGDVTQDGTVDIFDFLTWDADNQAFAAGYYATDFNGDGNVDIFDFLIWDPNNQNFIGLVTP